MWVQIPPCLLGDKMKETKEEMSKFTVILDRLNQIDEMIGKTCATIGFINHDLIGDTTPYGIEFDSLSVNVADNFTEIVNQRIDGIHNKITYCNKECERLQNELEDVL